LTAILGISAFYHDSAACLVRDGAIVAAAQEERFSRKKGDVSPFLGRRRRTACAKGIEPKDLVAVAF
jgi:carbamoyltransferase